MKSSKSASSVPIAIVQAKGSDTPEKNLDAAVGFVQKAAQGGAKIVALQELFRSPYFPQYGDYSAFDYAEKLDGPSAKALGKVAKEEKTWVIAPIFEKRSRGLYYNSAIVLDDKGKLAAHYRKLHLPQDAHSFSEKYYFAPGDLGYCVFDTPWAKIGLMICWDQWYPEGARVMALQGAEILFYPTAIGWHKSEEKDVAKDQREAWMTMHRSHAIANGVFVAAPNRCGKEGDLTFWGSSLIIEPSGRIVREGSLGKEELLSWVCDLSKIETQRHGWPFLRDRRVDMYGDLLQRFKG
ncbi:carbon-nitrogen hydrolase [Candidatus Micrarchaeota archaeon]|nr:carbon-nitrogen hydrolase [Candidatus Micrarchaeota archaeon]